MKHFCLNASAWKLFVVQTVLPVAAIEGAMQFQNPILFSIAFAAATLVFGGVVFCWLREVSRASNARLPEQLRRSTTGMECGLVFAVLYLATALAFLAARPAFDPPMLILLPHLLSMAAIFYALWFTAKQLTAVRQGGAPTFGGTLGRFFLVWYFPIGIWFLQPQVRASLGGVSA